MQNLKRLLTAFILIATFSLSAQSIDNIPLTSANQESLDKTGFIRCSTEEYNEMLRNKYPSLPSKAEFENWLAPKVAAHKALMAAGKAPSVVFTIPVVVHVIHDGDPVNTVGAATSENISDAQVLSQITVMNEDFRRIAGTPGGADTTGAAVDVEIEFCMAVVDPAGQPTTGINRVNLGVASWTGQADVNATVKPATIWDPTNYMNMWSVDYTGTGLLGYAQFPDTNLPGMVGMGGPANTDGVVAAHTTFGSMDYDDGSFNMAAPYDRGRTMTHEVGHWLGLRHVWGDGDCTVDDFCADTPNASGSNFGCATGNDSCPADAGLDQVENYMDYSDDTCMNIFTADQKARMVTVMTNSVNRASLAASTACSADYTITFAQTDLEICNPDDAVYTFDYDALNTFAGNIGLSATIAPAGPTLTLSQNTVSVDTTGLTLTVSGAAAGTYVVTFTSDNAGTTEDVTLNLTVYAALTPTTLTTPADAATGVTGSTLGWDVNPNATTYDIAIYSDAGLTTVIEQATGLTTNSYTAANLVGNTTYYWVITAQNAVCSTTSVSTTFSFTMADINVNCTEPTNLTATGMTETSAILAWTENGTATTWGIEIVPAGTAPTGVATITTNANPYTATGLPSGEDYDFYVYADCNALGNGVSAWVGPIMFSTLPCNFSTIAVVQTANCLEYCFTPNGPQFGTFFDFNTGTLPTGWSASPYAVGQPCTTNMIDNTDYFWAGATNGAGIRVVTTNPVDVTLGGTIQFYMRYGSDDPSVGCEDPDVIDEGVFLQYSIDNGATWVDINTWNPTGVLTDPLYAWNQYTENIPAAAQTATSIFRWYQPQNSGTDFDNWGLDNVAISANTAGNFLWEFGDGTTSTAQNPCHTYTTPGDYDITLSVDAPNCIASSTEVLTVADTVDPIAVCQDITVTLDATGTAVITAADIDNGSTDNCAIDTMTLSQTVFTTADGGINQVTLTVTDTAGNVSTCTANVTVPYSCGSVFTDTGGAAGDYQNNENLSWAFAPSIVGTFVTLDFTFVDVESCCDTIQIFDGPDATAPLLDGDLENPATFTSTHPTGMLFVTFTSDSSVIRDGWLADIICDTAACPTAAITYANTPFCDDITTAEVVTLTGTNGGNPIDVFTGGTYSATPVGLIIDATTGEITPNGSTAGTYTVNYHLDATANCPILDVTTTITITALPAATIAYASSPYCDDITTPEAVILTGTTGGVFSATPAGLIIDATTGEITPNGSTAGTYTVNYDFTANGGCAAVQATTTVDITALPTATITYAGTPFCDDITTAETVTLTGTNAFNGGTYTALPAGLILDATSGEITPNGSTPGTYTVTYEIAAAAGCGIVQATTTVDITALPTATITYPNTPYCDDITTQEAVTLTGTNAFNGGTFTVAPAGLIIDAATGEITPNGSTAGTYTVTYEIAANAGCGIVQATTTVDITALPTATITYAGTPFCDDITTQEAVTLTGTNAFNGGTYTALPAGLILDATTGEITPNGSASGTYTVTYEIAAAAGCGIVQATTTVIITPLPTAMISYAGTPFCDNETTPQATTLTGTNAFIGGTYTALPVGLILDTTTGEITPDGSNPGTYDITYTIDAANGCSIVTATTQIVIDENPVVSINYDNAPFCTSITTPELVTFTATGSYQGGLFSVVPAVGLTIDLNTGDIIPSTSTVGTYVITYTTPLNGGCAPVTADTTIEINDSPQTQTLTPLYVCDGDNDGFVLSFDLHNPTTLAEVTGGNLYDVAFYETQAEADLAFPGSELQSPYTNLSNPQIVFVRTDLGTTGCYAISQLELNVLYAPETPEFLTYTECDYFGDASDGIIEFDLTSYETSDLYTTIVANGGVATDYTTTYYSGLLVDGSPDLATAVTSPYVNTVNDQIIYAVVTSNLNIDSNNNGCTSMTAITLHVDTPPSLLGFLVEVAECDDDTDGFFAFDLTSYYTQITNDNLNDLTITFYDNGSVLTTPFTVDPTSLITNPTAFTNATAGVSHEVYVQLVNNITGCTSVALLTLDVNPLPSPLPQIDIENMSSCVNDGNGSGSLQEGYAIFDFTDQLAVIQGIEQGVSLTFHTSEADANADINEITDIANFYNTTPTTQTIWVRDENDVTGCYVLVHFDINVPVPNVSVSTTSDILCVDENGVPLTTTALPVISATTTSGLLADYTFQWYLNDVIIPGETNSTITVTQEGTYTVVMTDMQDVTTNHDDTLCINMDSTTITISAMPDDFEANVTTNAFAENQQILATATSSVPGVVFIYTLDGLEQNTTGIFDNVAPGSHIVTITDGKGCWSEDVAVFVIDYPKFFTPNGDGINDYWAINGQQGIPISQIFIFDRFGKLLKQLDPDSLGWDGSYNGNPMPATDYWFKIIYIEGPIGTATQKEFRAHFALKR